MSVEYCGHLDDAEGWTRKAQEIFDYLTLDAVRQTLIANDIDADNEDQRVDFAISLACEPEGLPDNACVFLIYYAG